MNCDVPSIPNHVRTTNILEEYPIEDFVPHDHDTWLFGFWGTGGIFDPYPELVDTFGEVDPDRFDFLAYERAVAEAQMEVSIRRLEEAIGEATPKVQLQKIGGKRRDGLYVQVRVDRALSGRLRELILGGRSKASGWWTEFSSWLERRYQSRPGFHPWHSDDPSGWMEATKGLTGFHGCRQGHKLGALLKFVTRASEEKRGERWDDIDIYYAACEASSEGLSPCLYYDR